MAKGLDLGKAFAQGILSKITDPEQRKAMETLMANETVMTELGSGVAGQSEIDRRLQELTTQTADVRTRTEALDARETGLQEWHQTLTTWHTQNKDALADYKRIKGTAPAPGTPNPAPSSGTPPAGLTDDQLNERIVTERAGFLGFQRDQNQITRDHFAKFAEIVDLEPLLRHPKVGEIGLLGVYDLVHKERLDKWKTDSDKAAEERIRADERQKVLQGQAQMPYLAPTGPGSGSPLDALSGGAKEPVVDAAVLEYNRIQAERAAGASR